MLVIVGLSALLGAAIVGRDEQCKGGPPTD
jgi:hypothetical protein